MGWVMTSSGEQESAEWAATERRPQCSVQEGGQTDFMHSLYLWLLFISLTAMDQNKVLDLIESVGCLLMRYQT